MRTQKETLWGNGEGDKYRSSDLEMALLALGPAVAACLRDHTRGRHPGSPPRLLEMGERCPCAPARIKPTDFYPQSLVIRICSNKALVPSHTCITVAQEIKRHLKRSKGWDLMAAWCNIRIFLFVFRQLLSIKCTFLLAEHSRDEFYGLMLQNTLDNTLGSVPALETWSSLSEESFWLFIQKSLSET